MDETIEIKYEVEDGYVGKSRPQGFTFDLFDIIYCDSVYEAMVQIEAAVEEDFRNRITWFIKNYHEVESKVEEYLKSVRKED
jgi:hypothetical protein